MKYKVYVIEDVATGLCVYVGCTKNKPAMRFSSHLYHASVYLDKLRDTPELIEYRIGACNLRPSEQKTILLCRHLMGIQPVVFKLIGEFNNIQQASDLELSVIESHKPVGNTVGLGSYYQVFRSE